MKPNRHEPLQSQEQLEHLARAAGDAVWQWDIETDALTWHRGMFDLFGYAAGDLAPAFDSWFQYIHPDDRDRVGAGLHASVARREATWCDEYRFRRADGTYAYVFDRGFTIFEGGRPVRMVGSMTDVTEKRRLQQARDESEERLRFALESAGLGTWNVDIRRGTLHWDARCAELHGLLPGETPKLTPICRTPRLL